MTKTSARNEHPIPRTEVARTPGWYALSALLLSSALLSLGACKKPMTDPPTPRLEPALQMAVPSAASVLVQDTVVPNANAAAGRSNSSLTRAQESSGMPLPGQNNDHSAPVAPTSSPKRP